MDIASLKKLESDLWEAADALRSNSKLTSNQYCMPVLGLLFLRYAFGRFKIVEAELLKDRPSRRGRVLPVEPNDFKAKSALYLPEKARYSYLVNLPEDIPSVNLKGKDGRPLNTLGEVVNNAMLLVEEQSEQLIGVLPKDYTIFSDVLLRELLRIFNNDALDDVGGDVFGRIYEYFLNKFAKNVAQDDGVFFTPKSLVKMIVNVLEPSRGILLDPACGSGGMFVQTGDFVNQSGMKANQKMTFYGQEKVEYNAQLCLMNIAVHGLNGTIKSGDDANTFYHDAHNLEGKCDYVMANPPFNVDKVKAETAQAAGRLPFGLPGINKSKEFSNANYLWIQYFYAYLNKKGRAGFVMASSATDSQGKDKEIRKKLIESGHVDVMMSVGNNFFYTKSLPCTLWFFDKGKKDELKDKVLFIDARNYYTVVDRTLNEWTDWQLKNLTAIVWLYRGETEKYRGLIAEYRATLKKYASDVDDEETDLLECLDEKHTFFEIKEKLQTYLTEQKKQAQEVIAVLKGREKKRQSQEWDQWISWIDEIFVVASEAVWLVQKFGKDGKYTDIPGLCMAAKQKYLVQKEYSLTPGAYVGAAQNSTGDVDFNIRIKEICNELSKLKNENDELMLLILNNLKGVGL